MTINDSFHIYDTTLRDGAQQEGLNLSVHDKLNIAKHLDDLGVGFIEGGWPGANPKDTEFFKLAQTELKLKNATFVAFGATRRAGVKAADDLLLRALVDSKAPVVTLVAKSHDRHVDLALKTHLDENLAMIADSIKFLKASGQRVFLDAEHFFDGYLSNKAYALEVVRVAAESGADVVALCDTNGGMLPDELSNIVHEVLTASKARLGIHCHNDTGCAVANSLAAVASGARHVQGTLNGLGERTGNTNLTTVIPNLQLKLGYKCLPEGHLERLTQVSNHVAEVLNRPMNPQAPYVGVSAFAHKAGLHVSAIARAKDAYEHVSPELVGNGTRFLVSEMAGRATITMKAQELGINLDGQAIGQVIDDLKRLEFEGYHFEAADASLELLMRRAAGWSQSFFKVESMRVITDEAASGVFTTEATVKVWVGESRNVCTSEGNGPVNAIDTALREALRASYPQLERVHLTDYKVRILDSGSATGAVTRVLIDATDGERTWTTIGVSANIIEASWRALEESLVFGLLHLQS